VNGLSNSTVWIKRPFTLLVLTLTTFLFFLFPFRGVFESAIAPRLLLTAVFLSSLYAVMRRRNAMLVAVALVLPPLVLMWGQSVLTGPNYAAVRFGANTVFLIFVSAMVLSDVMRTQHVTFDTISGGLAVYLLLGLVFTEIYTLILVHNPDAIRFAAEEVVEGTGAIVYFSFVTLTALGYGDIVPVSPAARAMASLEAVVGQVYLTVLVARLVGLSTSQWQESSSS